MAIAMVFIGSVSAAPVIEITLDNGTLVRTGYQADITIEQMQNGSIWIAAWDRYISGNDSELYYIVTSGSGATRIPDVSITNDPTSDEEVRVNCTTGRGDNRVQSPPIVVDVKTDKDAYKLGEPVNVSITATNNGPNITLRFPSSQLADFNITNETGQHIYHWSHDKGFSPIITEISINHSETIELLNDAWSQVGDDGYPVTPGKYYIDGWMVKELRYFHSEIHGERFEIPIYSGPRNIKRDAICELEAITPAQNSVRRLIDDSIWLINESLRNELWINDTHLNPKEPAGIVFDAEMIAAILLECVKRCDPTTEDAVNDVINKLTRADELIVLAVIDDRNPMAKEYLDKAYECLSKDDPVHAIRYFKLAWHTMMQS